MLRLLLLASLSVVAAAGFIEINGNGVFNLTCSFHFYGLTYQRLYVTFDTSQLALCLNRYYNLLPSPEDDCIYGPATSYKSTQMETFSTLPELLVEMLAKDAVPVRPLRCGFAMSYLFNDYQMGNFYYLNFGDFFVLYAIGLFRNADTSSVYWLTAYANSTKVEAVKLISTTTKVGQPLITGFLNLTGCRNAGKVYRVNTTLDNPEDCTTLVCRQDFSVSVNQRCDASSRCDGKGGCLKTQQSQCSVIGPNVIDINGYVREVEDRCVYTLLSTGRLEILAGFMDQRRTDISLLNSLYLNLDTSKFHLHQGAQVHMDGTSLNLGSSVQVFNGVELSKNESGVYAKVQLSSGSVSVFFDGSKAHISNISSSGNQGLCIDSGGLIKDYRRMDTSLSSCQKSFTENPDSSVNCTAVSKRCESMLKDPSLANGTKPGPFIEACTKTMCRYPDVDGLFCHFLDVYTRSSGLSINYQDCALPSPCVNHYCSPHEFCGLTDTGKAKCSCRGVFAAPYRKSGKYGESTKCGVDTASVELATCLVEEKGFNVSQLHLLDTNCKGQLNKETHTVTFSFSHSQTCSAIISSNQSQIVYSNTIMAHDLKSNTITRSNLVYLNFSCAYNQPPPNVISFKIQDSSVMQKFTAGLYNYTVRQRACTKPTCAEEVKPGDILSLGQEVWIQLYADRLDTNRVVLVIDSCWASNQLTGEGGQRHDLIINGCANSKDDTVKVGGSCSFSFRMFQFIGQSGEVHLHCKLGVCLKNGNCIPKCSSAGSSPRVGLFRRRRRSVPTLWTEAFTSMSWINQVGPAAAKTN